MAKLNNLELRKNRIRNKVVGTAERPRLSVFISNSHISVQIIDDMNSRTLASVTSVGKKLTGTMSEKAAVIGKEIGVKAKKAKINKVVFDRNGRSFAGRLKALADAARAEGLEF